MGLVPQIFGAIDLPPPPDSSPLSFAAHDCLFRLALPRMFSDVPLRQLCRGGNPLVEVWEGDPNPPQEMSWADAFAPSPQEVKNKPSDRFKFLCLEQVIMARPQ